jgi:hypothetical protein
VNKKLLVVVDTSDYARQLKDRLLSMGGRTAQLDEVVVTTYWSMTGAGRYHRILFLTPFPEAPINLMTEFVANKKTQLLPGGIETQLNIRPLKMDEVCIAILRLLEK